MQYAINIGLSGNITAEDMKRLEEEYNFEVDAEKLKDLMDLVLKWSTEEDVKNGMDGRSVTE